MSEPMTVSQINRYAAFRLREDQKLRGVLVRGEISNFTNHTKTGHLFFTLKDKECSIAAVMFSSMAARLNFTPSCGMNVIVTADVKIYEKTGVCQLYVSDMQPEGVGALYLAAEQLKEKLSAEGIFDEDKKKPLPALPRKIGIVTSPDAAALQDMLNILSRRYPIAEITVFPALVQGEGAPGSICGALEFADSRGMDLIICGRGGGSLEDLSAFNTEAVARALYKCNTPVISAVGHETDFTIADLAADLRAPTPSAAAELAVPEMKTLYGILSTLEENLRDSFEERTDEYRALIDRLETGLAESFERGITSRRHRLDILSERFAGLNPKTRTKGLREQLSAYGERLSTAYRNRLRAAAGQVAERAALLEGISPLKTLARGYSLAYKGETLVKSVTELSPGDRVTLRLADGTAKTEVISVDAPR